jgi:hypothetical protein
MRIIDKILGSVDLCGLKFVQTRGDLLFVAYMDVGKGRKQDAEALLGFYLFLHGCKPVE